MTETVEVVHDRVEAKAVVDRMLVVSDAVAKLDAVLADVRQLRVEVQAALRALRADVQRTTGIVSRRDR